MASLPALYEGRVRPAHLMASVASYNTCMPSHICHVTARGQPHASCNHICRAFVDDMECWPNSGLSAHLCIRRPPLVCRLEDCTPPLCMHHEDFDASCVGTSAEHQHLPSKRMLTINIVNYRLAAFFSASFYCRCSDYACLHPL